MRRLAGIVVLSLLIFLGPIRAQDDPKKGEPPVSSQLAQGMVEILKQEIELRPDQVDKVSAVLEKGMAHLLDNLAARANGEDRDDDLIKDEILGGLKDVLDEGQRKELEVLVKEFESGSGRFELGPPEELDPFDELDPMAPPSERKLDVTKADLWFEPDLPTTERLTLKVDNILILSENERKVVLPRVIAVLEARRALRDVRHEQRRGLGVAVHGGAREDEVKERLHGFRARTAELEKTLARVEEQLREVLTLEQEARLVAIGILD